MSKGLLSSFSCFRMVVQLLQEEKLSLEALNDAVLGFGAAVNQTSEEKNVGEKFKVEGSAG